MTGGGGMLPISLVPSGDRRPIALIKGKETVIRHLQELGFSVGTPVMVVGTTPTGMIVEVKGVRIAIDRTLANKILVEG